MKKAITDYAGKVVYIGIDVHKKNYHITAYCDGKLAKKSSVKANPIEVAKSFNKWFQNAEIFSVYEAGFSGFVLHRILVKNNIKNILINPASIEVAANDRVKTDSRDSDKMARQLSYGNLLPCHIPTQKQELSRLAQRTRDQILKKRKAAGNQIKSKLFQFGFIDSEDDQVMSLKYLNKVEKFKLPDDLSFTINILIKVWRESNDHIKNLDKKIKEENKKNKTIQAIEKVPGIGELSANIIYTELGNMSQFSNQSQLFSYLGLTPSEYSSGESTRKGRITRQGPARLRHILVEVAWRNLLKDEYTQKTYNRISKTRGGKRAIVACARKLIGRIRASILSRENFEYLLPKASEVNIKI